MINTDSVSITSIDDSDGAAGGGRAPGAAAAGLLSTPTVPLVDLEPATNVFKSSPTSSNDSMILDSPPSTSATPGSSKDDLSGNKSTVEEKNEQKADEKDEEEEKKDDSMFECNICLDTAKDAVVSMCGHLFCWPCLHQWLETCPRRQLCPVCKAAISKEKVIPLYGRGSTDQQDPRTKVPPRPAGQRTEPETSGFQGFGISDGGFHMSFGIGAFPLGYLSSSFNFDGRGRTRGERGD